MVERQLYVLLLDEKQIGGSPPGQEVLPDPKVTEVGPSTLLVRSVPTLVLNLGCTYGLPQATYFMLSLGDLSTELVLILN